MGESQHELMAGGNPELPLTKLDEYPFHQALAPLPMPATSDSHFNDGYYFGFFAEGQFAFFGLRLYPNTNVMDGYGGCVTGGEQRVVRASRALRPRNDELEVGPLRLSILEPMQRQRIELLENESGVSFDVTVEAAGSPFFESPDIHYRRGRLHNHVLRYTQMGSGQGVLRVDGRETTVDRWCVARDHSWGIRASMGPRIPLRGTETSGEDPRAIRIWLPFDLGGRRGMFSMHEDAQGNVLDFDGHIEDSAGEFTQLVSATHAFRYVEGTKRLTAGEFTLTDVHGVEYRHSFRVVSDPVSPQGYGYVRGWADGEPPGVWRGPAHVESDRFSVADPHEVAGPDRIPIARRFGACEYAVVIESSDGKVGMGQVEHMVYGPYEPYGFA